MPRYSPEHLPCRKRLQLPGTNGLRRWLWIRPPCYDGSLTTCSLYFVDYRLAGIAVATIIYYHTRPLAVYKLQRNSLADAACRAVTNATLPFKLMVCSCLPLSVDRC